MKSQKTRAREASIKLRPLVDAVLITTAAAKLERERVDAIQRKLLAEREYKATELATQRGRPERITDPKYAWTMDETDAAEYHAKLNAIHLAEGFERAADGYCPALCAESEQRDAERALIDAAGEFIPGLTHDAIWTSGNAIENHRKAIELLTGLVVCNPGYENPLERIKREAERKASLTT